MSLVPVLFAVHLSHADHVPGKHVSESDYLGELPVVLSVSRLVQPKQEVPVATTVIDRRMILASGAQDIASLLALVPGFQVAMVDGTTRSVTSHGFSDQYSRRMQVLVDGRPVYSPAAGGVLWQSLPVALEDVERIEVVRGPNAAAYGSNAFLGVINIRTRKPSDMPSVEVNTTVGSLGTINNYVGLGLQQAAHCLRIGVKREENNGFPERIDDTRSLSFNLRGDYLISPSDSIEYQAGLRSNDLQAGFVNDPFQPPRSTDVGSHYQQLVWNRLMASGSDLRIQYYHNAETTDDSYQILASDLDPDLPDIPLTTGFTLNSHRHDIEAQHRWSPNPDTRIAWGAGLRYDTADAPYLLDRSDQVTRSQGRMFINAEWHNSPSLILHGSVMGEIEEDSGVYLSPRVAANYLIDNNTAIRLSASSAYRFPALLEQYGHFAAYLTDNPAEQGQLFYDSAPDIRPERIRAYEIGLVQDLPRLGMTLDLKLFSHHVTDMIVSALQAYSGAESLFRFQNGGTYRVRGLEFSGSYKPDSRTDIQLAMALTDATGNRQHSVVDSGPLLADTSGNIPDQSLSLLVSRRFTGNVQLSGWLQHVGEMVWEGEGGRIPEHQRLDMRLAKDWYAGEAKATLSLTVQNLLDNTYSEFYEHLNTFDRRIYGQIAIYTK